MNPREIIKGSYSWAKQFISIHNEGLEISTQQTFEHPKLGMCFYLNIDGVVHSSFGFSTSGGVIRDGKGDWIMGYNRFLGKCSVVVAELQDILDGLLFLQKQGYDEVIIQSNNIKNIVSISDKKIEGSKTTLLKRIQQIIAFEEKWPLSYVPRESNRIASLTKTGLSSDEVLHMFEDPPLKIKEILKEKSSPDNLVMNFFMQFFVHFIQKIYIYSQDLHLVYSG